MKKIAIIVEGLSELIFTRELLLRIFSYENLSILCISIIGEGERQVPHPYSDKPNIHFQIVNVGNDERVLSFIRERFNGLRNKGFEVIIGLRDIYSAEYTNRSNNVDDEIIKLIIDGNQVIIDNIQDRPRTIRMFYAIMEFEAWLLSMPKILSSFNPALTIEKINEEFGYDLSTIIPQKEFFHPTNQMKEILNLVNEKYNKSDDLMERLISYLDLDELINIINANKCPSLAIFYNDLLSNV
jgi:hypothetical protein